MRNSSGLLKWVVFWGMTCVFALFAAGQVDQGRIAGVVLDRSNAAVHGATVTVKNERTGEERTTKTGQDGSFQMAALNPSLYTIRVSADGFAPAETTGVQLTVGQEVRRTFTLRLASASETVTVTEDIASAVDTSDASIGVNVNPREVSELPLNGRQVSQLFLQAPGSENIGTGTFGEIRLSGRSFEENAVRYDGIEGTGVISGAPGVLNDEVNTPFRLQASLENVQEFRVESNSYPAEYGTATGGQINVVTKSGSNAFHGGLFEYLRNDKLDARNFFDGRTKSKLRLNQFGASLGGPLIKDKLFFYGYYEGYRLRSGINNIEAVPHEATLAVTGQPVPATVDARVRPLLPGFIGKGAFIIPGFSTDPNFDIYQLNGLNKVDENSGGVRLDYRINEHHTLYARMFRDQGNWVAPEGVTGRLVAVKDNPQNAVLTLQSSLSSNVVNEAKIGFNEALSRIKGVAPTIPGVDLSTISVSISGNVALGGVVGQGNDTGVASPGGLVRSNSASNGQAQPYTPYSISYIDNLTWLTGKHSLKFGAEVRQLRLYTDRVGGSTYTFSNRSNFLADNVSSIAYLSPVSSPSPYNAGATGNRLLKEEYYIAYAQDEVRLRPNLTLNYGLRYEYFSPMREDRNLYVQFDTNTGVLSSPKYCLSPVLPAGASGVCPNGQRDWYRSSASNFAPRIGIAWSPFSSRGGLFGGERTVLRGGFGINYGPAQAETLLQPVESDRVWMSLSSFTALPGGVGVYCGTTNDATCGTTPNNLTTFFNNTPNNRQAQVRAYDPAYTVPERVYQYSASWQQQWGGKFVSTVAYVGSQGRNLFLRNIANRIVSVRNNTNPANNAIVIRQFSIDQGGNNVLQPYAEIDYKTSGGHDRYSALQTQLVRRSNSGLTLSAQYSYSTSKGNSSGYKEALTAGNPFSFDYDNGYNTFDIRHSFNLSALYDLPFGRNKQFLGGAGGVLQALVGNWELGTILSARSGLPVDMRIVRPDIVYRDNVTGNIFPGPAVGRTAIVNTPGGGSSRNVRRPDLIPGVRPFLSNGQLNPAAFAIPQPGVYGNLRRGQLHGPNYVQDDIILAKRLFVRESMNMEFRTEVYNIFNHSNFANPLATLNPTLGTGANQMQPGQPFTSVSAGNGGRFGLFNQTVSKTVGTGTNRQIQFALRLNF